MIHRWTHLKVTGPAWRNRRKYPWDELGIEGNNVTSHVYPSHSINRLYVNGRGRSFSVTTTTHRHYMRMNCGVSFSWRFPLHQWRSTYPIGGVYKFVIRSCIDDSWCRPWEPIREACRPRRRSPEDRNRRHEPSPETEVRPDRSACHPVPEVPQNPCTMAQVTDETAASRDIADREGVG